MIEARGAGQRRRTAPAFPGVETDVMMIAAGGDKRRLAAEPLDQLKAEHAAIKRQRPVEIGYFQMHMADAHAGVDRWCRQRISRSDFRPDSHHKRSSLTLPINADAPPPSQGGRCANGTISRRPARHGASIRTTPAVLECGGTPFVRPPLCRQLRFGKSVQYPTLLGLVAFKAQYFGIRSGRFWDRACAA